jgi:AFG3 family protein
MPKEKKTITEKPASPQSRLKIGFYIFLFIAFMFLWTFNKNNYIPEITWKQFETEMLSNNDVSKLVVINNERVEVYIKPESFEKEKYKKELPIEWITKLPSAGPHYYFNIGSVDVFYSELEKAQQYLPEDQHVSVMFSKRENYWGTFLSWIIPFILIMVLWIFLWRGASSGIKGMGSSAFNFGQSRARLMEKDEKSKITFKDVAGLEEAKEEIYELVKFLKAPQKYQSLGAKIPKGILLVGPPGTGKTLLAKAVAGEAGVPFFSLSGSEFIEMFVGVGAARMRDLFQKAKAKAPSIIFIDEIDTIGRSRGKINAFQSNDERESTLNQLLAELDGFNTDVGVIVLAATNRGDILDPALLRPGRFDRHIHLELPTLIERIAIFKVHMKAIKLAKNIDVKALAAQTPGFSGADIANICNEAALIAVRRDKKEVEWQDLMDAIDRVIGGLEKKSKIISPEEKKRIAWHEAGHVCTGWFLKNVDPVLKVSIIPRGRSLGASWFLPEEHQIITKSQFLDTIVMTLGGRAAEELKFDEISSNALDDLEKVTKQAYTMVVNYGLSNELRNISYYDSTGRMEQSLQKPFSERTAEKIDEEVQRIIDEAYDKALEILQHHRDKLDQLAEELLKKELLQKEDIHKILGDRVTSKNSAPV